MKKGYKIVLIILIAIAIILLGILIYNKIRKNQILKDAENVLQIDMSHGGYGIDGQKLNGKKPNTEYIEIEKGTTLYINGYKITKSKEDKPTQDYIGDTIYIKEINENKVELLINDELINLNQNQEYNFMNKLVAMDGLNYSYVVKFISK